MTNAATDSRHFFGLGALRSECDCAKNMGCMVPVYPHNGESQSMGWIYQPTVRFALGASTPTDQYTRLGPIPIGG